MKFIRELSLRNLKRKPARTVALILLTTFLSAAVFGGSMVILSLRKGLKSYEARLGADVVVVPYEASTKNRFESILLQGVPGYFYMDEAYYEKIKTVEGVGQTSPQFFLASTSSGCCSVAVQIIGFDPETDFTIQPWIRENYSDSVGDYELVVGNDISIPTDRKLTFYNTECTVVAQLEKTGTGLDTAVYTNMNTIKAMMKNAQDLGFHYFDDIDPERAVSAVMVKAADGYDNEKVKNNINIKVRHVVAEMSQSMVAGISSGLGGVSEVITILMALVWVLGLAILLIAFMMIANERVKEFAVLRVVGASKRMLTGMLRTESLIIGFVGSLSGVIVGGLIVIPFSGVIRSALDMPYLQPSFAAAALTALAAIVITVVTTGAASALSARRLTENETALVLREDA